MTTRSATLPSARIERAAFLVAGVALLGTLAATRAWVSAHTRVEVANVQQTQAQRARTRVEDALRQWRERFGALPARAAPALRDAAPAFVDWIDTTAADTGVTVQRLAWGHGAAARAGLTERSEPVADAPQLRRMALDVQVASADYDALRSFVRALAHTPWPLALSALDARGESWRFTLTLYGGDDGR